LLTTQRERRLRRHRAVEPAIDHLKANNRMDRCWLLGALGDSLHAINYAAGCNLRWLLRASGRLALGSLLSRLLQPALADAPVRSQIPWANSSVSLPSVTSPK